MKLNNKIGEIQYNKLGSKMTIINYKSHKNVVVSFDNGYETKATYQQFKNGEIRNPYDKSVYNIGYIGEGISTTINRKHIAQYRCWNHMIERCYNKKHMDKRPTYFDCTVSEEWHNFQNFAKWYDSNYYEIEREQMCLDKDILFKNNKVYSASTCIFVPSKINSLFTKRQNYRGDCPIGVYYHKRDKVYISHCNIEINGKNVQKQIGSFSSMDEAFLKYKEVKENNIKQVANEYKNKIPEMLYDAMYKYIVSIED